MGLSEVKLPMVARLPKICQEMSDIFNHWQMASGDSQMLLFLYPLLF